MEFCRLCSALVLACTALSKVAKQEQVSVDPKVTAYLGGSVTLRCLVGSDFPEVNVTQFQWTWESPKGKKESIAVFNPAHGLNYNNSTFNGRVKFIHPSTLYNPSISITHVNKKDEGRYTCEFTTFPSGSLKATTTLTILEKPPLSAGDISRLVIVVLLGTVLLAAAVWFFIRRRILIDQEGGVQ